MKRYKLLFLIFLCTFTQIFAQTSEVLQKLNDTLTKTFANLNLKGVSVAISFPNENIWTAARGNSLADTPLTPEMILGIGSNTKSFAAAMTLKMVESGKLKLNDSIYHWVKNLPNVDSTITVEQLLNHTSGIYDYTDNPSFITTLMYTTSKFYSAEEVIKTFVQMPYFPKGTSWHYSNTNYLIIGIILQKISKKSISSLFRSNFFDTLHLTAYLGSEETSLLTSAHIWSGTMDVTALILSTASLSAAWTAGGILGTAKDLVIWNKSLFTGKVLSNPMLEKMKNVVPTIFSSEKYGLGIVKSQVLVNNQVIEVWGHRGNIGYRSLMFYYPADSISIAMIFNDGNTSDEKMTKLYSALLGACSKTLTEITQFSKQDISLLCYPNPFCETLNIKVLTEKPQNISVEIFSLSGQKMSTLFNGFLISNEKIFEISNLKSGFYLVKLKTDTENKVLKVFCK